MLRRGISFRTGGVRKYIVVQNGQYPAVTAFSGDVLGLRGRCCGCSCWSRCFRPCSGCGRFLTALRPSATSPELPQPLLRASWPWQRLSRVGKGDVREPAGCVGERTRVSSAANSSGSPPPSQPRVRIRARPASSFSCKETSETGNPVTYTHGTFPGAEARETDRRGRKETNWAGCADVREPHMLKGGRTRRACSLLLHTTHRQLQLCILDALPAGHCDLARLCVSMPRYRSNQNCCVVVPCRPPNLPSITTCSVHSTEHPVSASTLYDGALLGGDPWLRVACSVWRARTPIRWSPPSPPSGSSSLPGRSRHWTSVVC